MIIAVVGAGGKTTLSNHIGKSLASMSRHVLFTTTTKILPPEDSPLYIGPAESIHSSALFLTAAKSILDNGKLEGYMPDEITVIDNLKLFDHIIVEADGSARKPIKAPNETEPVYPASVSLIIGVVGADSLGKPVSDGIVHRPKLFCQITGAHFGEPISARHITALIRHSDGLFRHARAGIPKVVFLNKCDTLDDSTRTQAMEIIRQAPCPVLLTARDKEWFGDFYSHFITGC